MAAEARTTRIKKRKMPLWALAAILLAVALIAGGIAWYVTSRPAPEAEVIESDEETQTVESTVPTDEPVAIAPTATPDPSKPSFARFGYVRAVRGSAGAWEADVDFFDIFTEAKAKEYASSHGMTVPSNGILFVNETEDVETFPISDSAIVRYSTGGVEQLTMVPSTIQALKDWAAGKTNAMPGSMTDQWTITVESGVVIRTDMLAIAD
jgi:hypothetical protein